MNTMIMCSAVRNRIIIVIVFALAVFSGVSQDSLKRYNFIRYDLNRLDFAVDSSGMNHVFRKMASLQQGKKERVTVVHIGGSHVQGGMWSNAFIRALQTEHKVAGGGYFVFPYKVGKTNGQPYASSFSTGHWKLCRPFGKQFCQPLGISALSVSTGDSIATFGVALRDKAACRYVNVVKVYHTFSASYELKLLRIDSFSVNRKDYPEKGYSRFIFTMPVDSVSFEVRKKDTLSRFILFGFSLENEMAPGFYLAGLGANGATSASFLRCDSFAERISTLDPDVFILSLGVNDTQSKGFEKEEYIEHYDSLISLIRKANPDAAIILTTTTDNYIRRRTSNKRTIKARDAMLELMVKHHIAVWDLFSIMGGYRSMVHWQKSGLASRDKVHFTPRGYNIVGLLMYQAFRGSYENFLKKS